MGQEVAAFEEKRQILLKGFLKGSINFLREPVMMSFRKSKPSFY
jgi:hypothetical protein